MPSCLITGANSGIGLAIAVHYWQEGWIVAGVDIDQHGLAFTQSCEQSAAGQRGHYYQVDVRDSVALEQVFEDFTTRTQEKISVVFANAGILAPSTGAGKHESNSCEVMDTNYFGAIKTVHAALQHMVSSGFIVISSSISALSASPNSGAYAASKAAIDRWTEGMVLTQYTLGAGPTLVIARIGFVDTPMIKGLSHAQVLAISAKAAAKRMAGRLRSGNHCIWVARRSVIIFVMLDLIGLQPRIKAMGAAYKLKCWIERACRKPQDKVKA